MSNTQQRYVRILPSAVESEYGWKKYHVGAIYRIVDEAGKSDLVKEGTLRITLFTGQISSIEPHHVQEVYVYDEPRVLPEVYVGSAAPSQPTDKNSNKYDNLFEELNQPTAKPMKVRVVKAGKGSWYETQVGEEFNVIEERKSDYIVEKVGDTWYHIDKEDCEIVTEPDPDRIAELEARVKALEEMHGIGRTLMEHGSDGHTHVEQTAPPLCMSDHSQYHGILHQLNNKNKPNYTDLLTIEHIEQWKKDVEAQVGTTQPPRDHVKAESNLDKAKRLYPKGTKFKSIGTVAHTIVSSGQFVKDDRGIYDKNESFYVNLGGAWAEIVQDHSVESTEMVKQWELTIDIPEWGLEKGRRNKDIHDGEVQFDSSKYIGIFGLPISIMPHIAKAVG